MLMLVAAEIPRGNRKNCDWSAWAACVFSCKFLIPVEIVESNNGIKEVKKHGKVIYLFNNTSSKAI